MKYFFIFVLVVVLIVSLTVWLILEPGRAASCNNSVAYQLGYIGLGMNPVQKPITVQTEYGSLSGSYQRSPVLKHLFLANGTYEPAVVASLEDDLRNGDVFVDVGAQEGYFSLVASHCVGPRGHVFAFETDPEHVQMIRKLNEQSENKNISILEFGPMQLNNDSDNDNKNFNGIINDTFLASNQSRNNTFMVRPQLVDRKQPSVWDGCPTVERYKSVWPTWLHLDNLKASPSPIGSMDTSLIAKRRNHNSKLNGNKDKSVQHQVKINTTELDRAIQIENETLGQHKIRLDRVRVVVHIRLEKEEQLKSALMILLRRFAKECKEIIFVIRMVPNNNPEVTGSLMQCGFKAESIDVYHTEEDEEWKPFDPLCTMLKYTRWWKPRTKQ